MSLHVSNNGLWVNKPGSVEKMTQILNLFNLNINEDVCKEKLDLICDQTVACQDVQ